MPPSNNVKRIWKPIIDGNHPILKDVLDSAVKTAHNVSKGDYPAVRIRDMIVDQILESVPDDAGSELLDGIQSSDGSES